MAARVCKNGVVVASWTRQFSSKRTNDLVCLILYEIRWLDYVCWMEGCVCCVTRVFPNPLGLFNLSWFFFLRDDDHRGRVCAEICCGTKTYKDHGQCSDSGAVCRG